MEIDDVEIPWLEVGQVLVQLHYSGICGAQIGEITGAKGEDKFLPHLLGHEGSGVVLDCGEGVKLKVGDNVVAHWREGKGIDANFPKYIRIKDGKKIGGGKVTTFAEYAVISENRLTKIPDRTQLKDAALMGCSLTTGLGLINNEAQLKIGQSIMVIGCGGVGSSVIQGAYMVSGYPIIAVDASHEKLIRAHEIGASMSLNTSIVKSAEEFVELVKTLINGVDIVVDTTGIPYLIEGGWSVAKEKMILVGQPHHSKAFTFSTAGMNPAPIPWIL